MWSPVCNSFSHWDPKHSTHFFFLCEWDKLWPRQTKGKVRGNNRCRPERLKCVRAEMKSPGVKTFSLRFWPVRWGLIAPSGNIFEHLHAGESLEDVKWKLHHPVRLWWTALTAGGASQTGQRNRDPSSGTTPTFFFFFFFFSLTRAELTTSTSSRWYPRCVPWDKNSPKKGPKKSQFVCKSFRN